MSDFCPASLAQRVPKTFETEEETDARRDSEEIWHWEAVDVLKRAARQLHKGSKYEFPIVHKLLRNTTKSYALHGYILMNRVMLSVAYNLRHSSELSHSLAKSILLWHLSAYYRTPCDVVVYRGIMAPKRGSPNRVLLEQMRQQQVAKRLVEFRLKAIGAAASRDETRDRTGVPNLREFEIHMNSAIKLRAIHALRVALHADKLKGVSLPQVLANRLKKINLVRGALNDAQDPVLWHVVYMYADKVLGEIESIRDTEHHSWDDASQLDRDETIIRDAKEFYKTYDKHGLKDLEDLIERANADVDSVEGRYVWLWKVYRTDKLLFFQYLADGLHTEVISLFPRINVPIGTVYTSPMFTSTTPNYLQAFIHTEVSKDAHDKRDENKSAESSPIRYRAGPNAAWELPKYPILQIRIPRNTPCIPVQSEERNEILLPPGTVFRKLPDDPKEPRIVHMEVLPDVSGSLLITKKIARLVAKNTLAAYGTDRHDGDDGVYDTDEEDAEDEEEEEDAAPPTLKYGSRKSLLRFDTLMQRVALFIGQHFRHSGLLDELYEPSYVQPWLRPPLRSLPGIIGVEKTPSQGSRNQLSDLESDADDSKRIPKKYWRIGVEKTPPQDSPSQIRNRQVPVSDLDSDADDSKIISPTKQELTSYKILPKPQDAYDREEIPKDKPVYGGARRAGAGPGHVPVQHKQCWLRFWEMYHTRM
jgi:hypothetical protein